MNRIASSCSAIIVTASFLLGHEGVAAACGDVTKSTDFQLLFMHSNACPTVANATFPYSLTDDSWDPAGAADPCSVALPLGKMLNSIDLITQYLTDDPAQWHLVAEYSEASKAVSSSFHGNVSNQFRNNGGTTTEGVSLTGRFNIPDHTEFWCPLFDAALSNEPVERAAVIIHEMWHHWQQSRGISTSHIDGPLQNCGAKGPACDHYYFHKIEDFVGKSRPNAFPLVTAITNGDHELTFGHSPYQIHAEFLCDVSQFGRADVPFAVKGVAQRYSNIRTQNSGSFTEVVSWQCGNPAPF